MTGRRWRDRRVLVTGATGLIGARLVRRLLREGADILCLVCDHDPRSALHRAGDADRVAIADGRLERFDLVRAAVLGREVDTVFHLGAQALVGVARRDPLATFEANVRGTYHLLEACRMAGGSVPRIVLASSDKAYGDTGPRPADETTPLAGRFPYDVSKACGDLLGQSYAATYGLPVAIARCGNVFGPGDRNWSRLVPGTIRALLRGERPVLRSDGSPVRDYLYVDDAVAGYLALAAWLDDEDRRGAAAAFNFAGGAPMTVLEMTRRLRVATGREDLEPVVTAAADGELETQRLDCGRARRELGWAPVHDLDDGLDRTVRWYRDDLRRDAAAADAVDAVDAAEAAAPAGVGGTGQTRGVRP